MCKIGTKAFSSGFSTIFYRSRPYYQACCTIETKINETERN